MAKNYQLVVVNDVFASALPKELLEGTELGFDDKTRTIPIQIISAGISKNRTRYSDARLEELHALLSADEAPKGSFRSKKMFIDHITLGEDEAYTGRSLNDWAATIVVTVIPKSNTSVLQGLARVTKKHEWIYYAAKEQPEELGVSVHIGCIIERLDDLGDGHPGIDIVQIIDIFSTDFVTEASAKGGILENIDVKMQDQLLKKAAEIANTKQDTKLTSIIEGLRIPAEITTPVVIDVSEAAIVKDKKIRPFTVVFDEDEQDKAIPRMWWAMEMYLWRLMFSDETKAILLKDKINAAVDTVTIVFNNIAKLVKERSDAQEQIETFVEMKTVVEDMIEQWDENTPVVLKDVQMLRDLTSRIKSEIADSQATVIEKVNKEINN